MQLLFSNCLEPTFRAREADVKWESFLTPWTASSWAPGPDSGRIQLRLSQNGKPRASENKYAHTSDHCIRVFGWIFADVSGAQNDLQSLTKQARAITNFKTKEQETLLGPKLAFAECAKTIHLGLSGQGTSGMFLPVMQIFVLKRLTSNALWNFSVSLIWPITVQGRRTGPMLRSRRHMDCMQLPHIKLCLCWIWFCRSKW